MIAQRTRPELELIKEIINTGFQAAWLKNPDNRTQGPRWDLTSCGCDCHAGAGCDLCPAFVEQLLALKEGRKLPPVSPRPENLFHPLRWKNRKNAFASPEGDLFHPNIPDAYVLEAFDVMKWCSQHKFVMTTKRPEYLHVISGLDHTNVFVGVSIEEQKRMYRADALLDLPDNFWKVLFLAPMLTDMVIPEKVLRGIDWVVCSPERGGVGRTPRPCDERWIQDLIKQIESFDSNIPIFLDMPFQKNRVLRLGGKYMDVLTALMT
jgi:protein gp37